jgi:hypothetical protein
MEAPALNLVSVQTHFHIDVGLPRGALEVEFIPGVAWGHPKADRGNHTPRFELIRDKVPCRYVGERYAGLGVEYLGRIPNAGLQIVKLDEPEPLVPRAPHHLSSQFRRYLGALGCFHAGKLSHQLIFYNINGGMSIFMNTSNGVITIRVAKVMEAIMKVTYFHMVTVFIRRQYRVLPTPLLEETDTSAKWPKNAYAATANPKKSGTP